MTNSVLARSVVYRPRRNKYGVKLDAPCQRTGYGSTPHTFVPWDAHPGYSRCYCGLLQGPRGGLYEGGAPWLPSPVDTIVAKKVPLWPPDELPALNYFSRAGLREWNRQIAERKAAEAAMKQTTESEATQ